MRFKDREEVTNLLLLFKNNDLSYHFFNLCNEKFQELSECAIVLFIHKFTKDHEQELIKCLNSYCLTFFICSL